ncbi:MAG: hypothetical protein OHK0015_19450 [Chloroflexi bacterium OHK40]
MPIVFVHGAGTREYYRRYHVDSAHVLAHLRHYVAPVIAPDPQNVAISVAYWGDIGVELRLDGTSLPPTPPPVIRNHPLLTLLPRGRRRHLLAELWLRLSATLGYYLGRIAAMLGRPQSRLTAMFIGDALYYFAHRGTAERPGAIPARVLGALRAARENQLQRGGEPLIVFTHSLGGSIFYDVLTHFLPNTPGCEAIHVDFWASLASQVGLFEEMQLFLASDPAHGKGRAAPFPDRRHLGAWWNVWDPHDFLSFSVRGVIEGVDDEFFDSGLSVTAAHLACLRISSFYAVLGRKVAASLASGRAR